MEQFKRKKNWDKEATLLLGTLIEERKAVVKGKYGPNVSSKEKKAVWVDIAAKISEAFPDQPRTPAECEKRWYAVQSKSRQKISSIKKHHQGTGGGPALPPLSPVTNKVWDILGDENPTLVGDDIGEDAAEFDCNGVSLLLEGEDALCSTITVDHEDPQDISQPLVQQQVLANPSPSQSNISGGSKEIKKLKCKKYYQAKRTACKVHINNIRKNILEMKKECEDFELKLEELKNQEAGELLKIEESC